MCEFVCVCVCVCMCECACERRRGMCTQKEVYVCVDEHGGWGEESSITHTTIANNISM